MRSRLLNAEIDRITMDELLARREGTVLTLHVDMLGKLQRDREFYDLLQRFDVVTCDSQIMYFAARIMRRGIPERVSGSDYFPEFYSRYRDDPAVTIFLCGAMNNVAEQAMAKINAKVGRQIVVGAYGPPPNFESNPDEVDKVIRRIDESGASVLVVGLGAPRQERFIFDYRHLLPKVRLFLPLGGTIDYEAGQVRRPPAWVTTVGLEWCWRLLLEPRRRWKRYLVQQPPVLLKLAADAVGLYRNPFR